MSASDHVPLHATACDRFAAEWQTGGTPRLEDYLGAETGPERVVLFRSLLVVEVEARARRGEAVRSAEYKPRFPGLESVVLEVFRDIRDRRRSNPTDTAASQARTNVGGPTNGSGRKAKRKPLPTAVGRFEVLELLGEGSFGHVFRARDPQLGREVALKVPREGILSDPDDRERFLREARAAATLQHSNLCPVYEVGQDGERDYIVMAYVPGQSLASILKGQKEPLPDKLVITMVRKLALALDAAHQKSIVHRDLKPANVLYDRDRKELVVTDFGLARRAQPGEAELTHDGAIIGTPAYMSPEQARGDTKTVGPLADVYSLGVILYELLAGRRPFIGTVGDVIGQVLHVEPVPPSQVRPGVDPRLEAVCQRAMAKDPAARYADMREFAAALAECERDPSADATTASADAQLFAELTFDVPPTAPAAGVTAVRKPRQPHRRAWVAGAGVAALFALVSGIALLARVPTPGVLIDTTLDLTDRSLSFALDGAPIGALALAKPVDLAAGTHDLVAMRDGKPFRTFRVTVGRAGKAASVTDVSPPPSPPPPTETPDDEFARWALALGIPVTVQFGEQPPRAVRTADELPKAGVRVTEVRAAGCKNLTDANSGPMLDWLRRSGTATADLAETAIGDATVEKLTTIPTIRTVVLRATTVTDRSLGFLSVRTGLTAVDVSATNATDEGLRKLAKALPKCRIVPPPKATPKSTPKPPSKSKPKPKPKSEPKPIAAPDDGFTPLFNGKDLTGWKVHSSLGEVPWSVEDGALTCNSKHPPNVLFTERGDFRDIHVRVECKFNEQGGGALGGGGLVARAPFSAIIAKGYQVQIGAAKDGNLHAFTGSLRVDEHKDAVSVPTKRLQAGAWVTVELIVRGFHCTVKVNGEEVVNYDDAGKKWDSGHIGLQFRHPFAPAAHQIVWFRKVEVKELPTAP